jgi:hypothetical protein
LLPLLTPIRGRALIRRSHLMRQVFLHPGENGLWVAECPNLPSCISQGDTKESAIKNFREAIG